MEPFGVISNPVANRGANESLIRYLEACAKERVDLTRAAGFRPILHRVTESPEDIPAALIHFRRMGIRMVLINGGDGTLSEVVNAAFHEPNGFEPFLMAPLASGTVNTLAGELGIQDAVDFFDYVQSVEHQTLAQTSRSIPTLAIKSPRETRYGFVVGWGVPYAAFDLYNQALEKSRTVPEAVLRVVGRALVDPKVRKLNTPIDLILHPSGYDGVNEPFTFVLASTLDVALPIHKYFKPAPFTQPPEGEFNLLVTEQPVSIPRLIALLWGTRHGDSPDPRYVQSLSTSKLTAFGTCGDLRYMLDGDLHQAHTIYGAGDPIYLETTLGPSVQFVQPAN